MNYEWRNIEQEDFKACALSLMDTFKEKPWNENWTYEEAMMRIDECMASRMSRGFVIMDGEKAIGTCIGRVMTYTGFRELYIDEFSIHPAYQGQKLGSKLIDFVRAEMKKEEIETLCLTTIKGYPSVEFYQKKGFKLSETVVFMHD